MDPRYPIGKFAANGDITAAQRDEWIEQIRTLPGEARAALRGIQGEQLEATYREGGWTIRQVVHHLADSHMNSFVRFKLALTEDHPTIKPYDEERWATLADGAKADVELSLTLLEALHERWVVLLRAMSEADFARTFYHPGSEQTIRLDRNLGIYAWHGKHHVAHIELAKRSLR